MSITTTASSPPPKSHSAAASASDLTARRRSIWQSERLPWVLLGLCAAAFVYGVRSIASATPNQFGLLASASPFYALSILLAAAGFAVAMRQRNTHAAVAALCLMIVCHRLPRAISTEVPMYAWTYKHLGVVDYIQQNHSLARSVDIYNGWPGLFALTAWFSELTGLSAIDIAHWFTPVFHFVLAGLIYAAARAWRLSPDRALMVTFLVVMLNWVEQDYFSPQATALILTAGIFILIGLSRERPKGVALILIIFAAATITHQLTPYWVFLVAFLLVLGRRLKPWWLTMLMLVILIGFFLYNFDITHQYTLFSADVVHNAKTNNPRVGMVGQLFTSTVMRLLALSMWSATAIVLVRRWGMRQPVWALGVLALSPILILGGQNYGGEAIFRVFLYSLPGCAFVLAPVMLGGLRAGMVRFLGTAGILCLATLVSVQAYFGSWSTNLMTNTQVRAADAVLAGIDYPAYVTPLVPVWPERSSANYVKYAKYSDKYDHSMMFQEVLLGMHFDTDADYDKFMTLVESRTDAPTYVVLSEPMRMYGAYFGLFPMDAMLNLRKRLADDPRWDVVEEGPDVGVYLHRVTAG